MKSSANCALNSKASVSAKSNGDGGSKKKVSAFQTSYDESRYQCLVHRRAVFMTTLPLHSLHAISEYWYIPHSC